MGEGGETMATISLGETNVKNLCKLLHLRNYIFFGGDYVPSDPHDRRQFESDFPRYPLNFDAGAVTTYEKGATDFENTIVKKVYHGGRLRFCPDVQNLSELLRLALDSSYSNRDVKTKHKWAQIKMLFPQVYSLGKPWGTCSSDCVASRDCPNVYVRRFYERDVAFLYNVLAAYLNVEIDRRTRESFSLKMRSKHEEWWRRSSIESGKTNLKDDFVFRDYDFCEYVLDVLKVLGNRFSQANEILEHNETGEEEEEKKKVEFKIMNAYRFRCLSKRWWVKNFKHQARFGVPDKIRWFYAKAPSWVDLDECTLFDMTLARSKRAASRVGKMIMNNPHHGAFEAFLKGQLERYAHRKHLKICESFKIADLYTNWLIKYDRIESCFLIFDAYLSMHPFNLPENHFDGNGDDEDDDERYFDEKDGESAFYKMYKREVMLHCTTKRERKRFTCRNLEKYCYPQILFSTIAGGKNK
jgi:hypothetical protein